MSPRHVLVNGWFVSQMGTGSGQYLFHMLEALPAASPGTRWTLLTPWLESEVRWQGVDVVVQSTPPLPGSLRKLWWEQVTMPRAAGRLGVDLLWTPYWAAPYFCPVPHVVTVHDLIPLLLPDYRGGLRQRAYTALVAASARRATRILTVSQASARDVVEHLGIPSARVTPVWHGPNILPPAAEEAPPALRAKYGLPERYFLYLGGFDPRKNLESTLAAYARFLQRGGDPSIRLVIAGRLPERFAAFAPDPARIAQTLGITGQIDWVGWVDEADKAALYAGAVAFLFPSLYEGFGMPLLEAMQAGTPVVTSR